MIYDVKIIKNVKNNNNSMTACLKNNKDTSWASFTCHLYHKENFNHEKPHNELCLFEYVIIIVILTNLKIYSISNDHNIW